MEGVKKGRKRKTGEKETHAAIDAIIFGHELKITDFCFLIFDFLISFAF
jgi:hypothetical protein